jgi:TonB family protein
MRATVVLAFLALTATPSAALDDPLLRAKELYEAAAYEEALATLSSVVGVTPADRVHVEQYRAFSLFALGRLEDAERAITSLVAADPVYVPSAHMASPKVLTFFSDVRERQLPVIVRRLIDEGRGAFGRKDASRARNHFQMALTLLADPAMARRAEAEDMKVVAAAFLDLTGVVATPPPAPSTGTAAPVHAIKESVFVPAQPIRQAIPTWEPPSRAYANDEFNGAVRVTIGADGKVKTAVIERATHPAYDVRLLQAARSWMYKPATRDGKPVESDKVIAVRLQPTQ